MHRSPTMISLCRSDRQRRGLGVTFDPVALLLDSQRRLEEMFPVRMNWRKPQTRVALGVLVAAGFGATGFWAGASNPDRAMGYPSLGQRISSGQHGDA